MMKAGFCKVNIMPEKEGIYTNLYGANIMVIPDDIGDDIFARILVLDDGTSRQAIIATDLCFSSEEENFVYDTRCGVGRSAPQWPGGTKEYIAELTGLPVENIFLMAAHNHLAPISCRTIHDVKKVAAGINQAIENMQEVTVGFTETRCTLVKNRRPWSNTLNTDLPHDTKVRILCFYALSGKMLGSVVNYACHGTILRYGPYPHKLSGEFMGIAMNKVESEMGSGFVSLFMQGASGDNGPELDRDYAAVQKCGEELGDIIIKALKASGDGMEKELPKSLRSAKRSIYPETNENAKKFLKLTRKKLNLGCIMVGDIAIICVSGELFNSIGQRLMKDSPYKHTLISTCTDGNSGYLPSYSAFHDGVGGYELCVTPYTDALEASIYANVMKLLQDERVSIE